MTTSDENRRGFNRNSLSLSAVVKGRESSELFWKEKADLLNVSRVGASFNLEHECSVGRVLSLIMNMPKKLRIYDREKKLYRVWGLVQHCRPISENGQDGFQIGVAFIGKHPPESYSGDPLKSYRISGVDSDGFWNVGETKTPFVSRAHHRFNCAYDVRVALIGADEEEEAIDENGITENIGAGGAAVFSDLEANSGDRINFICDAYDYSSLCVVTNRQNREGGKMTLHLQFAEPNFPVTRLAQFDESESEDDDIEAVENSEEENE